MRLPKWIILPLAVLLPQAAHAAVASSPASGAFAESAIVSDETLATERAGYAPASTVTQRSVRTSLDDQSRAVERFTAGLGRTSMDVWWGSTGSEMIAINVRAAAGR